MNLLNKLTIKNLKLNKRRTIVTVIGIILSVAMLTAVASMFFSARASLIAYQLEQTGNYHYSFKNVQADDIGKFKLNRKIESMCLAENLGYAKLDGIANEYKPYVYVKGFTEDAFTNLSVSLVEGRFPQNNKEVVIPWHLTTNGGMDIKVGDTLTLEIGTRMCDGFEQTQDNPYDPSQQEEIVDTRTYEYQVVGIIDRPSFQEEPYSAPGYTLLTYADENNIAANADIYVRYIKSDLKNHLKITANILGVDEEAFAAFYGDGNAWALFEDDYAALEAKATNGKYEFVQNANLLTLETGILKDRTLQVLATAGVIVVLIIIFTSVYCIKNSFDISITEKIKQYGMLSSIGATKKQIKRNVYNEAFILGTMGIPFGMLAGIFASYVLIHVTDYLIGESLGFQMQFAFSWLTLLLAVLLGVVTIFLSARKSANRASKIAPIQAIRNSDDIKISAKNVKTPKWVKRLFGIGGEISYKNLQRSKKKYRTTVISIMVCVIVFISVSTFVDLAFATVNVQFQDWNYNMMISYYSEEDVESKFDEIKKIESIEQIMNQSSAVIRFTTDQYSEKYLEYCAEIGMFDEIGSQETVTMEDSMLVYVIDNAAFQKYAKDLGLDFEDIREKGILINHIYALQYLEDSNQVKQIEMDQFTFKEGDVIRGTVSKDSIGEEEEILEAVSIEIAAVTDKTPFAFDNSPNFPAIIVGEDNKELILDYSYHGIIYIDSKDAAQTETELEKILGDDYGAVSNFEESAQSERSLFTLIAIFLYGFITVIALIGVTNIFNTITTNMNLRRREFAMLKSVGMTKKEFNRMIQLESFFYGMKSLAIGIPIGCMLSYLIYYVLTDGMVMLAYKFPLKAIIISIASVFLLITVIMRYSISKIGKQNIIETIRNENI